jgi:O-antigen/teichoic acid export membrane protein
MAFLKSHESSTLRSKVLKGGIKLASNQAVIQVSSFVRNVILARLITTSDFGIASIFAMTFYLLEMISNLAAETLLIQAKDGDEPELQSTAQMLQSVRGFINGALLILLAGPFSRLFGVPQAHWAFAGLGLVPMLKGVAHLDPGRLQRHMRFEPYILTNAIPSVLGTLLAYPLGVYFGNYVAMLWLLILQTAIGTVVSHVSAERKYSWTWNRIFAKRIFDFGWPLLINGMLMYLIFQGDRFIIGSAHQLFPKSTLTLSDLGVYSAAFALTLAPSLLIGSVGTSLFLPMLANSQEDTDKFRRRYLAACQIVSLAAALISIPLVMAGGDLVVLIYGQKYAGAQTFIVWLVLMQFLRMMRVPPTLAAMAHGDTTNAMYSNLARTSAFAGVLVVAAIGMPLQWVAASGFFGEIIALTVCVTRLSWRHTVPGAILARPASVAGTGVAVGAVIYILLGHSLGWPSMFAISACFTAIVGFLMFVLFPHLREFVQHFLAREARDYGTLS